MYINNFGFPPPPASRGGGGGWAFVFPCYSLGEGTSMDASRGGIFHVSPTQLNRLDIYAHSFRRLRQPSRGAFSFLIVFCFPIISNMDWKIKITPPSPQSPREKKSFWEGRLAWSCCTPLLIFFFTFGKGVMERGGRGFFKKKQNRIRIAVIPYLITAFVWLSWAGLERLIQGFRRAIHFRWKRSVYLYFINSPPRSDCAERGLVEAVRQLTGRRK